MLIAWIMALALTAGTAREASNETPSPTPAQISESKDVQAITALINDQYTAWNRRDLDGYMVPFWQSPKLIFVSEGRVSRGWAEVKARMERNYPDRTLMGVASADSVQVSVVTDDSAMTIERWVVRFARESVKGITTSSWRKFQEGWRIVGGQSDSVDLPN
jgi:ketosteroid isomerase-like protein